MLAGVLQAQEARIAPDIRPSLKIPSQHPYLLLTREELTQAQQRAAERPSAKEGLEALIKQAREIASKPVAQLPPKGDEAHWSIAERLVQVGLGYAFTGDAKLAEWACQGLLAYADLYHTNSPSERKPLAILRRKGTSARFLTVLEPLGPGALDEQTLTAEVR